MKKVLWFSRHPMTPSQLSSLGEVEVTQINGSMENIHKPFVAEFNGGATSKEVVFKTLCLDFDILAIVAPIGLQQQILGCSQQRPVIVAKTNRILVKDETGGEDKVVFDFAGWERLVKIEVLTEPFN
jgi:hypothetical protein